MDYLEKFIYLLQGKMETPQLYGWFHIMWLAITALAVFLLCRFCKNAEGKSLDRILRWFAVLCLIFEGYKQLVYTFDYNAAAGTSSWDFEWYAFPFQFCSTPMYVALIASFLKEGRVKNALIAYLATFGMLAGILVMAYPATAFISMTGINIQTMFHHGGQLAIGMYLLICKKVKLQWRSMLGATAVFLSMVAIALLLNLCAELADLKETFNMFYIRYGEPATLPVYEMLYPGVLPYPVFLLAYIVPFVAVSCGIFAIRKKCERA